MATNTRDKLMDATVRCLLEHGHAGCTVKQIARLAGVNHGLVHHYFGSKEQLMLEVLQREAGRIEAELDAVSDSADFRVFARQRIVNNPPMMRLMVESMSMAEQMPALAEAVREIIRRRADHFQRTLGLPDRGTALVVMSCVLGLALFSRAEPEVDVAASLETVLRGLGANRS